MIVVDASVASAWCFEDEATPATDELLARVQREGGVVPPLWAYEIANVLVTGRRRAGLSEATVTRLMALLNSLPLDVDGNPPNSAELVATAELHELTAHDAAYLEVASRRGLSLATLDQKLATAARDAGVAVLP